MVKSKLTGREGGVFMKRRFIAILLVCVPAPSPVYITDAANTEDELQDASQGIEIMATHLH
jgi:hypothetical protein